MAKICNKCGSANEDSMRFCINCGSAFAQAQVQMPEQPKIKRPIYEQTDYAAIDARNAARQQPVQHVQPPVMQNPMQAQPPVQQRPQPVQLQMQYGQQMYAPAPQMQQSAPPKAPKKKNLTPIIVSIVAAVVVIGVALGVIFGIVLPNKEKEEDKDNKNKKESTTVSETVDGGDSDVVGGNVEIQPMAKTIAAGGAHTMGLKTDGTVVAVGKDDSGIEYISDWTDIVAIEAGGYHSIGLRSDGLIVTSGNNYSGQRNVTDWTDIVAVAGGLGHTVGLKSDGTVVAVGDNDEGQCNVSGWTDILAVSAGSNHTVGLKSDGTVVAVGDNGEGQCDVSGWTDIVAISTQSDHTVGLKSNGTVVAIGLNDEGQCDVFGWTDIVEVSAGYRHTVGLKSDGTVVVVGDNHYGQSDVAGWTDIVEVSAGSNHTVGLKSDGTVVAVGDNYDGRCNVSGWSGIKTPDFEELKNRVNGEGADNKTPGVVNPDVPSVDTTEPVTVPATEIVTEMVTERITEKPTERPTEQEKIPYTEDWKASYNAYLKMVYDNRDEYHISDYDPSFGFAYINDDNIPELLVSTGQAHASQVVVATFVNGEVVELGKFGSNGELSYVERESLIIDVYIGGGYFHGSLYEMGNGGSCKEIFKTFNNAGNVGELRYEINDKIVSEEEYDVQMAENWPDENDTKTSEDDTVYDFTYENIDKYCK